MKIDLENINPGTWFDFSDGEGRICLRICAIEDLELIRKQTRKKKIEYKRGQRFEYEEINNRLEDDKVWDFAIMDWKGVYDADDKEIKCTKENKIMLMRQSVEFANFIAKCLEDLEKIIGQENEEAEKNSETSQDG